MTAVGPVVMRRMNLVCVGCRASVCPLDGRLGLTEYLSPQATRLCCLAGGSWSFDRAAEHLNAFCGVRVSDELIRRVAGRCAPKIAAFAATAPEPVATFARASGDVEFETDAVKVNTVEGWRDAKIGIFAKRPRGPAAEAADWATRPLPKPAARFACAAIEESTDFALRWAPMATHLGVDPRAADLTVLGDGAEWIWNRAREQFPHCARPSGYLPRRGEDRGHDRGSVRRAERRNGPT